MAYLLKGVNYAAGGNVGKYSFFIQNNKIASVRENFRFANCMYSDLSDYAMGPTHVMADLSFPNLKFHEYKHYIISEFLLKGCTTLLVPFRLEFEYKWEEQLNKIRNQLVGSPIDYCLAVRIPFRLLTPSLIRKCRREKISTVFVELTEETNLYYKQWGWIRDALFPYPVTLVPLPLMEEKRKRREILDEWTHILDEEGIPHLDTPISSFAPLSKEVITQLGIYPQKGFLHVGGEVSYNLYHLPKDENKNSILYDSNRLCITVDKGNVIRAGEQVWYRSGAGNEIPIRVPRFFKVTS
ncbi:hypothetical protein GCM10008967_42520 [Bacillus carboniphilus]|uniref:Uncharacterized protein n=1 Tax=Bacillus carboniphilus TaxID=86663 RepID=A0ABN0WW71_9BACI